MIAFVGVFDMLKTFLLFWPANAMPIWLFVTLLQLKIPLTTFFRSCCIEEMSHYAIHWLSALVILVGCIVGMLTLKDND